MSRQPVKVALVYFEDCPNWKGADEHLRTLATDLGFVLEHRVLTDPDEAEAAGFPGSPTILIDGRDPFARPDRPFGLSCRLYDTPEGPAGSPTCAQLRHALSCS